MIVKVKVCPTWRWWASAKVRSTQTPFGSPGAGCRPDTMSGRPTRYSASRLVAMRTGGMAKAFVGDPMNDGYRTTPSSRPTASTPGTLRISATVSGLCRAVIGVHEDVPRVGGLAHPGVGRVGAARRARGTEHGATRQCHQESDDNERPPIGAQRRLQAVEDSGHHRIGFGWVIGGRPWSPSRCGRRNRRSPGAVERTDQLGPAGRSPVSAASAEPGPVSTPAIASRSEVMPQPDGPMMAMDSLGATSSSLRPEARTRAGSAK